MPPFTITLDPVVPLTDEAFYQLCRANPDCKLERSAEGELIIMPPTGGESSRRKADIKLPNGAERSPDAAWVVRHR
jgi:Uma2 family endonuclease